MSKSENKTLPTEVSVGLFLSSIENKKRKADAQQVYEWMCEITGVPAQMWGDNIVGFGNYHYKYASGREGNYFKLGLSPRKASLTIYIVQGLENFADLLAKLGKYTSSVSCLYIKKLEDIDTEVLKELMRKGYDDMTQKYG